MSSLATSHHPFDRLWRPGHPFRPRRSKGRRWCIALMVIFTAGIVSSYWYLTDPARVRDMCQSYLSELVGGPVHIDSASLSILEGLQLKHVVVKADDTKAPDSVLFVADEIGISYDPASLLRGRLQATRIVATGAHVSLVEDEATGKWNYQRLKKAKPAATPTPVVPTQPAKPQAPPLPLPEIVLRDAKVEYGELQSGRNVPRGSMGIEGRFFLANDHQKYNFELQSRGAVDGVGPAVTGDVRLRDQQLTATLSNFRFGRDIEAMLPREVREFWIKHHLEGAVDIPDLVFTPAGPGGKPTFHIPIVLQHVKLMILPEEMNPPPPPLVAVTMADVAARTAEWFPVPQTAQVFPPLPVDDVTGRFEFDEKGLTLKNVSGTVAGNTMVATGRIESYSADAPVDLTVESPPNKDLVLPEKIAFLPSLPKPARDGYAMLQPHGTGSLSMHVVRKQPGATPEVSGLLTIKDGSFNCVFFPYPVRNARGAVRFLPDPSGKFERVELLDITASGVTTGPNAGGRIHLNGWAGIGPDPGCHIMARGENAHSEPELINALPLPARNALKIFGGADGKPYPDFTLDFNVDVVFPPGPHPHPNVQTDLVFHDGRGMLRDFPYPLDGLTGAVNIRDGWLDVHHVTLGRGSATVDVDGKVTWPTNLPEGTDIIAKPNLKLTARGIPLDDALLAVLPPDPALVLRSAHAAGLLDVDGMITGPEHPTPQQPVRYDLDVRFHDGNVRPMGKDWTADQVSAKLRVASDRVDVRELTGRHGNAVISGSGSIDLANGKPDVHMILGATDLPLDPELKGVLPSNAQDAWTGLAPVGRVNAELTFHAPDGRNSIVASQSTYKLLIHPRDMTVTAAPVPYRLDHVEGTLTVEPNTVTLTDVRGSHGKATVNISGRAMTDHPDDWDLTLSADHVPVDKDLIAASPPSVRKMIASLKLTGEIGADVTSLRYRAGKPAAAGPDLDLGGTMRINNGTMDAGVPLTGMAGKLKFDMAVRNGSVAAMKGNTDLDTLSLAERPIKKFAATLTKPVGLDVLRIENIRGNVAGGAIDGHVALTFPDQGASGYELHFAVENADVRDVAKQIAPNGQEVRGQVSASLDLQGDWSDIATRRGRGEVKVQGEKMYQIPLLLGLMEVTNLSLPSTDAFSQGTASYGVVGNRVTFSEIQLRSNSMVMSGNGWLDFGSKKVRMNFTTANPNMPHLPVISDLIQGVHQELMQIQIRGSVQDPKVSTGSLHTFTTTVDEVFSGKNADQ
jgi:hypothetical protein